MGHRVAAGRKKCAAARARHPTADARHVIIRAIMQLRPRMRLSLPFALLAGFALAGCSPRPQVWNGTAYENPPTAPTLPVTSTGSDPTSDPDLTGHVSLIYFGYTHCTDFCPATLAIVAELFERLGDEADDVRFYFVTVDPERDTGDALTAYLDQFDSRLIGVRPDPEALPPLLAGYAATAFLDPDHADEGIIAHTTRLFLVDKVGKLRAHYPFDTSAVDLLADVRYLLRQG